MVGSNYYKISSVTGETTIDNGQPVSGITIAATATTSGGTLTTKDVEINGTTYHYVTVKKRLLQTGLPATVVLFRQQSLPIMQQTKKC
ncbi:MAG: hypothetical protein L6V88_00260 [Anaerotruncus sp.]|nr:MAG: hypothetical protein L6V88_00260 [Anaerotruncus sp.]